MPRADYWLGVMRRVADEVRSLSEGPTVNQDEQRMYCGKCEYVLLTRGHARQYCPNGCGELRIGAASEDAK